MNKLLLTTILVVAVICGFIGIIPNKHNDLSDLYLSNIEALTQGDVDNPNQTCTKPLFTHDCYRYDSASGVWMWASKAIDAVIAYKPSLMEPCEHAFKTPCPPGTRSGYNGF
ncbi:MAG: hypothetical protein HDS37_02165 [Bacteroides sp.]|nr:hypothetical protein [Bacteroides sp.]